MKFALVLLKYEKTQVVIPVEWIKNYNVKTKFDKLKEYFAFYSEDLACKPNFDPNLYKKKRTTSETGLFKVSIKGIYGKLQVTSVIIKCNCNFVRIYCTIL
jgi:hypothetical protein